MVDAWSVLVEYQLFVVLDHELDGFRVHAVAHFGVSAELAAPVEESPLDRVVVFEHEAVYLAAVVVVVAAVVEMVVPAELVELFLEGHRSGVCLS